MTKPKLPPLEKPPTPNGQPESNGKPKGKNVAAASRTAVQKSKVKTVIIEIPIAVEPVGYCPRQVRAGQLDNNQAAALKQIELGLQAKRPAGDRQVTGADIIRFILNQVANA